MHLETRLLSLVAVAFTLLACSRALAPNDFPADTWVVERTGAREVAIVWNGDGPAPSARVFVGSQPSPEANGAPVAELEAGRAVVNGLAPESRPYFTIVATGESRGVVVAERVLPLEGAHNFRDLGGYQASDGRRVRWGRVYRSDDISELSDADIAYLSRLGLRLVCDFRSAAERDDAPDRLPTPAPETALLAISDSSVDPTVLRERILSGDLGELDFAQLLVDGNRSFASAFSAQYGEMFERLGDAQGLPALLHCTAGKDRTGFGAALVLLALGVPEQTVYDDYLLTNATSAARTERMLWFIRLRSFGRADVGRIRPLLEARREYLSAGLDEVVRGNGSVDRYLREALGVDDEERAQLRTALLN
ncbi:MAG: tyrosine-protein phosphatase [Myxococcota bacterium]